MDYEQAAAVDCSVLVSVPAVPPCKIRHEHAACILQGGGLCAQAQHALGRAGAHGYVHIGRDLLVGKLPYVGVTAK